MEHNVFYFPDDATDTSMTWDGDSYIAKWRDTDGVSHCEILDPEQVETAEWENERIPEEARGYYSEEVYYYHE